MKKIYILTPMFEANVIKILFFILKIYYNIYNLMLASFKAQKVSLYFKIKVSFSVFLKQRLYK